MSRATAITVPRLLSALDVHPDRGNVRDKRFSASIVDFWSWLWDRPQFTLADAAHAYGVHKTTIRRWLAFFERRGWMTVVATPGVGCQITHHWRNKLERAIRYQRLVAQRKKPTAFGIKHASRDTRRFRKWCCMTIRKTCAKLGLSDDLVRVIAKLIWKKQDISYAWVQEIRTSLDKLGWELRQCVDHRDQIARYLSLIWHLRPSAAQKTTYSDRQTRCEGDEAVLRKQVREALLADGWDVEAG